MLKKRIVAVFVLCCVILSGCSIQKTDTSDIKEIGINAVSEVKSSSERLDSDEFAVLLSAAKNAQSDTAIVEPVKAEIIDSTDVIEVPQLKEDVEGAADSEVDSSEVVEVVEESAGESKSYNMNIDAYLASMGVTYEEALRQNEKNREEEAAILKELQEKEAAYLEEIKAADKEWDDLVPTSHMSFDELVGDNGIYEYPEAFPLPDTYKIIVDLKYQVVMVYTKDEEGKYTIPVRYMLCSSGANKSQSPVGTFEMKNYRVRFSRFVNTDSFGQYWSLITGRIYFHSVLYSSKDASDYTTSSWNNLGKNVSHGCIRLTVPDARFIYYNMAPGTVVEIRKGSSKDTETKEIRDRLIEGKAEVPSKRLKLKAGKIPNTDNWQIDEVPHIVDFVQGHQ